MGPLSIFLVLIFLLSMWRAFLMWHAFGSLMVLSLFCLGGRILFWNHIILFAKECWMWRYHQTRGKHIRSFRNSSEIDFIGFFLFGAVGDALALGVEMVNATRMQTLMNDIRSGYFSVRTGKYAINYVAGQYSDDTEQTLSNAKALIHLTDGSADDLLQFACAEYDQSVSWWHQYGRQGHGSIKAYLENRSPDVLSKIREKNANGPPGNAPIMRGALLGFIKNPIDLRRITFANADMTHPHPTARFASYGIAIAVHGLIVSREVTRPHIIKYVCENFEAIKPYLHTQPEHVCLAIMSDWLARINEEPAPTREGDYLHIDRKVLVDNPNGLGADALTTLGAVLYFVKHLDPKSPWTTFENCVLLGGDVDTLASVVMSIAGAQGLIDWINFSNWPRWTIDGLEGVDYICEIATQFEHWFYKQ